MTRIIAKERDLVDLVKKGRFVPEMIEGVVPTDKSDLETYKYFEDKPYTHSDNHIDKRYTIYDDGEYRYYPVKRVSSYENGAPILNYYNPDSHIEDKDEYLLSLEDLKGKINSIPDDKLKSIICEILATQFYYEEYSSFISELLTLAEGRFYKSFSRQMKDRKKTDGVYKDNGNTSINLLYEYYRTMNLNPEQDKLFTPDEAAKIIKDKVDKDAKFTIEQIDDGYILKKVE